MRGSKETALEAHKKEKKELHHKLSEEGKRQDELQQQLKANEDEYQAQLYVLKKQESDEISKLKHELSGNGYVSYIDILLVRQ